MYKIEGNVPVPSKSADPFVQTLILLEPGESFLVTDLSMEKIMSRSVYHSKKNDRKFLCRRVQGGVRVWRVK